MILVWRGARGCATMSVMRGDGGREGKGREQELQSHEEDRWKMVGREGSEGLLGEGDVKK